MPMRHFPQFHQSPERGSLGLIDAIFAIAVIAVGFSLSMTLTQSLSTAQMQSGQIEKQIQANNVGINIAAVAAFNPTALSKIAAQNATTLAPVPLPTLTPFPGASAVPNANAPTYTLAQPTYEPASRTLSGTVQFGVSKINISVAQRGFGEADCNPQLVGQPGTGC